VQFIKFAAIILGIFSPIVLVLVSPDIFWFLFAVWIGCLLFIVVPILLKRFFR